MGRRQHYLLGYQLAQKYQQEYKGFLDPNYNPNEIFVRATDYNRTIESALSQLQGLYKPGSPNLNMNQNQISKALPLFKISKDIIEQYGSEQASVPFLQRFVPVHVHRETQDLFQPPLTCPIIQQEREKREQSQELKDLLRKNHPETIQKIAETLNQTYNDDYDPMAAIESIDSIWSRTFEQHLTPGFDDPVFLNQMMDLYDTEFTYVLTSNETTRQLFATGVLTELAQQLQQQVIIDKDTSMNGKDRLKLFIYSDHDDSITVLTKTFSYSLGYYPKFASQILFELSKKNDKYYVSIIINDIAIEIPGVCNKQTTCEVETFIQLLKDISYYGREKEYNQLCGLIQKNIQQTIQTPINLEKKQLHNLINQSRLPTAHLQLNSILNETAVKIVVSYILLLSLAFVIYKIRYNKKSQSPMHKLTEEIPQTENQTQ